MRGLLMDTTPSIPKRRGKGIASTTITDELRKMAGPTFGASPDGLVSLAIRYGTATETWTSGNTITLTPCVSQTDSNPTGEADVECDIFSPAPIEEPEFVDIVEGDPVA